jgi:hypothetical protein
MSLMNVGGRWRHSIAILRADQSIESKALEMSRKKRNRGGLLKLASYKIDSRTAPLIFLYHCWSIFVDNLIVYLVLLDLSCRE